MLVLDGKKVADTIYSKLLLEVSLLPVVPRIVFILVGQDPASQTYVKSKSKKCQDLGLHGEALVLPENTSEEELIRRIRELNLDKKVHGILLQLPLPPQINKYAVLSELDPLKDVDGLHPDNMGRLMQGNPRFVPCTPSGILEILRHYQIPIEGTRSVVIGRSEIVGKPMAQLLLNHNSTVTVCHSKTVGLEKEAERADLLVVAIGKRHFVGPTFIKEGATVIDVGIHRVEGRITGDVDYDAVAKKAGAITPVPGGVGPMTIASLMKNLVLAAKLQTTKASG